VNVFTKHNIVSLLQNGIITISFIKNDGTERTMNCTLLGEYLPNNPAPDQVLLQENARPDNLVSVWDVDAGAWKSFYVDKVKSVTIG